MATRLINIAPPGFGGKKQASDTWAWITRTQWADYENRFAPREEQLLGMATYNDPSQATAEIDSARETAGRAFDTASQRGNQFMSRFGAGALSGEERSESRQENLGKSAAVVDAANRITQKLIDQNRAIALGAGNSANAQGTNAGGALG